jgi:fibronectin-binding autotransporter adhesin
MVTRTLSRWLMSVILAALTLAAINLLVATSPVQGRPAAALINCSGSIQACIDAANDGDTILIAAGTYTESLTLSKAVSLTGVSSDTTIIHAIEGQRVLTVTGATISNSIVISGLTFTGGSADIGGGMLITDSAQPLIRNSIFISNAANLGGGLYTQGALLTIIDTDFIANVGGGAYAEHAAQVTGGQFIANTGTDAALTTRALEISGTRVISNNSVGYAGGVDAYSGPATIINARFENNVGNWAGGLYVRGESEALTLSNTVFISNSGGGFTTYNVGPTTVYGGRFERNHTSSDGGAILMSYYGGPLILIGTEVVSNTANGDGGGIAGDSGTISLINSRFENNVAGGIGGGVKSFGTQFYVTDTQFISNTAHSGGGGLQGGYGSVTRGRFERNSAPGGSGGGLQGGEFVLSDTVFISNTAGYGGGGVTSVGLYFEVKGGRFEGNRTLTPPPYPSHVCGGGGLFVQFGHVSITGTQFISNASAGNGGGMCTTSNNQMTNVLFVGNTSDADGPAIYLGPTYFSEQPTQHNLSHLTIVDTADNAAAAISVLSSTLNLTNTIITNHAIGISNTAGIVYEDYNLFFNIVTNTVGVITDGGHSLIGDPKFVDPFHGDYHLQFGSAAIDRGVDAGIYTDLDGNLRPVGLGFDIGAYEYQGGHYLWLPLIRK